MKLYTEPSRIFSEYLLIPGLTTEKCTPDGINIKSYLTKFREGHKPDYSDCTRRLALKLNVPITSAIMQSVSDDNLAIELAKSGGLSFIYCSQSIESQCEMVRKVKKYKSGFVTSDSNLKADDTFSDILKLRDKNGHSTMPVTEDGSTNGKLIGLITSRDYREGHTSLDTKVTDIMTPISDLIVAYEEDKIDLSKANTIIFEHKLNVLPIINKKGNLKSLVFRKDYSNHANNRNELLDSKKGYMVGAGVNTHDYEKRIPKLVKAGADVLCIDSSDGYTVWQKKVISFVREKYGDNVKIGAGNVIDAEGFNFLADAGADFIKVGIGGGSICITREQKGIGCGQASAVMDVANARDTRYEKKKEYIPICSDGGITMDYHVTLALAMGADFVMMGRYFARFDEAPGEKIVKDGKSLKEYWGEGSNRAKNWQRYEGNKQGLKFEEGVDSYVPYAGKLKDNLDILIGKLKATMCNCGCINIKDFHRDAKIRPISAATIREGGAHDVILKSDI